MTIIATAEGAATWQQELRRDPAQQRQVRLTHAARRDRAGIGAAPRTRTRVTRAGPRSWLRSLRHQFT